jgi:hypothetical protein
MDGATISSSASLTRTLAERAIAVTYDALPEPVRELARQCVLDYLAVGLAGADDPLAHILLDEMVDAGGAEQAAVIGHNARLPMLSAALVNGSIAHALDYDDVNLAMPGHVTVAILPALLALAEESASLGQGRDRRLCRRIRDLLPHRHGDAAGPLHARLSRDRHGRRVRRRGGVRAPARPRWRGDRPRAGHRRHAIGRPQIAIRDDVQAVPRRQGRTERVARGPPRRARVFGPSRSDRMHTGLRRDPRARFLSRKSARRTEGRFSYLRQPLQVPCRLLHDPRADRMRPATA